MSARTRFPLAAATAQRVGANDAEWGAPANIFAEDAAVASASFGNPPSNAKWLQATDFRFAIPNGAIITGVRVRVKKRQNVSDGNIQDKDGLQEGLKLIVGGARSGSDKGTTAAWPASLSWISYGGQSDMWGVSLKPSDVNASNFGVALGASLVGATGFGPWAAEVDAVEITVWYRYLGRVQWRRRVGSARWKGMQY